MEIKELKSENIVGLNNLLNSIAEENIWTVNENKTLQERIKWFKKYEEEKRRVILLYLFA